MNMTSISNDSFELLKQLVDASPDLVYALDTEGRFMFLNPALEQLFGVAPQALIGKTREACLPLAIAAMHHANDQQVIGFQRVWLAVQPWRRMRGKPLPEMRRWRRSPSSATKVSTQCTTF
jgi:PAS domain-containing protein